RRNHQSAATNNRLYRKMSLMYTRPCRNPIFCTRHCIWSFSSIPPLLHAVARSDFRGGRICEFHQGIPRDDEISPTARGVSNGAGGENGSPNRCVYVR